MGPCFAYKTRGRLDRLTSQARYVRGHFSLGRDKARCLAVRFLIPPVEHRACDFHRTRRSTFGRSPWTSMKRLFPFLQLHSAFPVDSLRVRWVPLFPSFQRLVERFVNSLQVISASAPLPWLQLGGLAPTAWLN